MKKTDHSEGILNFVKIIDEIEAEIQTQYIPGCMNWVDEHHNNAWTKTIDRLDRHITWAQEHDNHSMLAREQKVYRDACLKYIKLHKDYHEREKQTSFLENVNAMMKGS
jgi:hypothetical protein